MIYKFHIGPFKQINMKSSPMRKSAIDIHKQVIHIKRHITVHDVNKCFFIIYYSSHAEYDFIFLRRQLQHLAWTAF